MIVKKPHEPEQKDTGLAGRLVTVFYLLMIPGIIFGFLVILMFALLYRAPGN